MRYLARRFGEFFGYNIPAVLNTEDIPIKSMNLENRNKPIYEKGDIIVLNRVNRLNAKDFVRNVLEIRIKFPDKLLYVPFLGLPYEYPVLFYTGIDILDNSTLELLGDERCVTEFGIVDGSNCHERNESERKRMTDIVTLSLRNNKFREVVEFYSFFPFSKEILRTIDMEHFQSMQNYMDLRPKNIMASSIEGLYRPEIVDFRKRIISLNQTADNLLLIPCSAIKPYSKSKTHRILHSFIGSHLAGIQEVIVTSPLGLVPREIESFFPARYYDIPVTGYWFNEEKSILVEMAIEYFRDKKYSNVFYILTKNESDVLQLFSEKEGIIGSLNQRNSEEIARVLDKKRIKGDRLKKEKEEFKNQLKFLYDIEIGSEKLSIKNEGNRHILMAHTSPLLKRTFYGIQMMIGLADMLVSAGKRTVEIDGIFKGENIFIPGIKRISDDIKPGMEVVLTYQGNVVGRGISELSDFDLRIERKGKGISEVSYFKERNEKN